MIVHIQAVISNFGRDAFLTFSKVRFLDARGCVLGMDELKWISEVMPELETLKITGHQIEIKKIRCQKISLKNAVFNFSEDESGDTGRSLKTVLRRGFRHDLGEHRIRLLLLLHDLFHHLEDLTIE